MAKRPLKEKVRSSIKGQPPQTESPFEKYRGVGNPGIATGRKAINRYVRYLRGR
jgi:hypothetical protein